MTDVLLCVGNSMMGDDGAGPLLAEKCAAAPKGHWVVIDGGSAPDTTADCRRHGYGAKPRRDPHHRPG